MAEQKLYVGSVGPFLYNDVDTINDPDGDFSGANYHGIATTGQIYVETAPTDPNHVMRFGDIFTPTLARRKLNSDVVLTTANTWYDILSETLAAGTWIIIGTTTIASPNNLVLRATVRLWDGTTLYASGEATCPAMGVGSKGLVCITLSHIITLLASTTVKISATATVNSCRVKAAPVDNNPGGSATTLRCIRIK